MDVLNHLASADFDAYRMPLAVLVGIAAIFATVVTVQGRLSGGGLFLVFLAGLVGIAAFGFLYWSATRDGHAWVATRAVLDWPGADEGWTSGGEPAADRCGPAREGQIALCWTNRPNGYPAAVAFAGDAARAPAAWCTYKRIERTAAAPAGAAGEPGTVFVCARTRR